MYESFYRLKLDPFLLTPDSRFVFAQDNYEEAFSHLKYGLIKGEGFVVVTGSPGAGKTTLIEDLLSICRDDDLVIGQLQASPLKVDELLRLVEHAFGIEPGEVDRVSLIISIQEFLREQFRYGRRVLLIVDEAQNLSIESLEQLRLLANIQSRENKHRLQVFLLGQPALRDSIRSPQLEQLRQRIVSYCQLEPLSLSETRAYILHRLQVAGWRGDPEFTAAAITRIHDYCGGVPRRINLVCGRLLLNGLADERHRIDERDVIEVIAEMPPEMVALEVPDKTAANVGQPRAVSADAEQLGDSFLGLESEHASGTGPSGIASSGIAPLGIAPLGAADVPTTLTEPMQYYDPEITAIDNDEETEIFEPVVAEHRPVTESARYRKRHRVTLVMLLAAVLIGLGVGYYSNDQFRHRLDDIVADVDQWAVLQEIKQLILGDPQQNSGRTVFDETAEGIVDNSGETVASTVNPREEAIDTQWPESFIATDKLGTGAEDAVADEWDRTSIEALSHYPSAAGAYPDQPIANLDADAATENTTEPDVAGAVSHAAESDFSENNVTEASPTSVETTVTAPQTNGVMEYPGSDAKTGKESGSVVTGWRGVEESSDRFSDSGVVMESGRPKVSRSLEDALSTYAKQIRRLDNGSLSVTPQGSFEYTANRRRWDGKTQSSLEGIAYVMRNFHSVGVAIVARGKGESVLDGSNLADDIMDYFKLRGVKPDSVEVIDSALPNSFPGSENHYLALELVISPVLK